MNLLKIIERNKVFLFLHGSLIAISFVLISITSCEGCGNKNNKGGYIPNVKGNIAGIKVDKPELTEPERDFVLSFIPKENKKTVNLSNYKLYLWVIDGEVSYTHFGREGKDIGKKVQGQTSAFSLGVPLFFEQVEFTAEDVKNDKVNILFTIVPKPGVDWVGVSLELVKKGKNGEKSKGKFSIDWRK